MINMESIKINQMVSKLKVQHQIEIELLESKFNDFKLYYDNIIIKLEEENQKLKKELSDLKEFLPELKLVVKKLNKAFNLKEKRCIK